MPGRGTGRKAALPLRDGPAGGVACQLFVPPPPERWLEALSQVPRWTAGRLPLEGWSVPPVPPPAPRLPGTRVRVDQLRMEYRQNPIFVFRLLWRADRAHETRLALVVDGDGQWVEPAVLPPGAMPSPSPGARGQVYGLERLLQQAVEALPRWASIQGADFLRDVEDRRLREQERLDRYYRGMEAEAAEPLRSMVVQLEAFWARAMLPGAPHPSLPREAQERLVELRWELAGIRERLARERQRRVAEVMDRYRVRLEAEPVGAALLWAPHVVLQLTVRPDKGSCPQEPQELEAAWNLAQGRWSGLGCQGCGREAERLVLCSCPRFLCPACSGRCACGEVFCEACAWGTCAGCLRPTCSRCARPLVPGELALEGGACPECGELSDELLAPVRPWLPAGASRRLPAAAGGR